MSNIARQGTCQGKRARLSVALQYCVLLYVVQILVFQTKQRREYYFVQLNTQYQIVELKKLEVSFIIWRNL